jgi:fibronectin type 3 domain-containing protein
VTLSWDGSSNASGYNVYRDTSPFSTVDGTPVNGDSPVEPTGFTDDSVDNGTRYYYRVTAVGDGGESDPSPEEQVRPFPPPPDDRP